jgi:hypothetical protein
VSRLSLSSTLVTVACAMVVGCGWTLGLGGYSNAPDDGGVDDGRLDESVAPEGSSDTQSNTDTSAVDCTSDPNFACVPAVPRPWDGPYEIFEGTGNPRPSVPACGGLFPTSAFDGQSSPSGLPASCGCTCAFSGTCGSVAVTFRNKASCAPPNCGGATPLPKNVCVDVSAAISACTALVAFTGGATPTGTCAPTASTTLPPAFTREIHACGIGGVAPQRGCPGTDVCAPKPAPMFDETNHCIALAGMHECPAGYGAQRIYYGGASDSRDCTACGACGAASAVTCSAPTVSMWSNTTCSGAPTATNAAPMVCTSSVGTMAMKYTDNGATGTCGAATAGSPTGSVTPTLPMTFCCMN